MERLDISDLRVKEGELPDLGVRELTNTKLDVEDKDAGKAMRKELRDRLGELQEQLYVENSRSVLLVLQGMDTSGKDGTIRRVFRQVSPQGLTITAFGVPTEEELAHDYLWRIHAAAPPRGNIGIFNRSHYEDVGVVRVNGLIDEETVQQRFHQIREFEQMLADNGTVIRKCLLDISPEEQRVQLQERIDEPDKNWKFNRGDLEVRAKWHDYMRAYSEAIAATSTEFAPWYLIPADRRWISAVTVAQLMVDTLEGMDIQSPPPNPELKGMVIEPLDDQG